MTDPAAAGPATVWSLATVLGALRKLWYVVVACTLIGGAAGYGYASSVEPQFQSRASLYFALDQGTTGADLNQGGTYTQNQMLSFARLATSSRVLRPVIAELGLPFTPRELARTVAISIPQDTVVLEVTSTSGSPERAAGISNAVARQLSTTVEEVAAQTPDGEASITATVIDDAVAPTVQSSPNKPRDALLAAALGFMAGVLLVFALTIGDTRVRNAAAVARVTDLPVLGSIGRAPRDVNPALAVARDPRSTLAEDMRRVQSALAFAAIDADSRLLLVTSSSPSEGKSTFASNLALTLVDAGERVLVIDGDLRRPRVGSVFGIDGSVGLTSTLMSEVSLETAIARWREDGPDVLTSGVLPPNPASVITSQAFKSVLDEVSGKYDSVIIDSPPVLTVADANLLAPLVDGVIVVADASATSRQQLGNTLRSLESAGGVVLGIVLNRVRGSRRRHTYYVENDSAPEKADA